jgi:PPM family protein phosphatase
MGRFETVKIVEPGTIHCDDRVAVIHDEDRTVIVVADGAGGIGNGDVAAETVIREIRAEYSCIQTAEQWNSALRQIDCRIASGESTTVVVDLRPDRICGSSVGDSQAWIIHDEDVVFLTAGQKRKPLLGSRDAIPASFEADVLRGILIVATDGFFNYVKRPQLLTAVAQKDFYELPRACVELVRLPSGALWDDIGLVACRVQPTQRTRQRYSL